MKKVTRLLEQDECNPLNNMYFPRHVVIEAGTISLWSLLRMAHGSIGQGQCEDLLAEEVEEECDSQHSQLDACLGFRHLQSID